MEESAHIERAGMRLKARARQREVKFEAMREEAARDAAAIVARIVAQFRPIRIYQWGSVLRPGGFRDYSDIDIAVEGVTDAQAFFGILADVEKLTRYPLDIVQIEKIAPEYAGQIRSRGKVVYERQ